MTDIVKRLTAWTIDWNGSRMVDGEPPRDGLHCDELREAAAEIERLRADMESECERRDEIIASETHLRKQAEIDRDHYKSIYENAQMEAVTAFASGFEAAKEMAAGIVSSLSLDRAETAEAIRSMEKHK